MKPYILNQLRKWYRKARHIWKRHDLKDRSFLVGMKLIVTW